MSQWQWQAVVAGVGGQGVLFVTRLLALAAQRHSEKVLISEVHGMAQRGGSVVSHLKAGGFASPLVAAGQAELVLSLDPGEAIRNLSFLAPGADLVVNAPDPGFLSPEARAELAGHGVRLFCLPATGLAQAAGALKGLNVVMVAAAAAAGALPFSAEEMAAILDEVSPPARREANARLFAAGSRAGAEAA